MPNYSFEGEILLEYLKLLTILPESNSLWIIWEVTNLYTPQIIISIQERLLLRQDLALRLNPSLFLYAGMSTSLEKLTGKPYFNTCTLPLHQDIEKIYDNLIAISSPYLETKKIPNECRKDFTYFKVGHIIRADNTNLEKAILEIEKQYA